MADYAGITWERIEAEDGVFWPCPRTDHPGTPRMFTDSFATPDGRARFHPVEPAVSTEEPDEDYPLWLVTGRLLAHYQSGAQTRRIAELASSPGPFVEVHPVLASALELADGDLARLSSRRGSAQLTVRVVDTIRPDTIFAPFHWGGAMRANTLTDPTLDPVSADACLQGMRRPAQQAGGQVRRQVVVVGHGLAGTRFVEKLCGETGAGGKVRGHRARLRDRGGYNRVLLTEVLAGARAEGEVFLHTPRWYADRGVTVRDGVRAVAIDRDRSAVICDDGTRIGYDHLVLATGSSPVLPPIRGLRRGDQLLPGCFAFRTLADCAALVAAAGQAKRAVVVGGGVLGLEAARGLATRGLCVEVVHRPEFLMNNQLDAEAATVLRRVLRDMGIACYVATGASAVDGDGWVAGVRLSDRFVLDCEHARVLLRHPA